MGEKILEIQQYAIYLVDNALPVVYGWLQYLPGDWGKWIYLASQHPAVADTTGAMVLSGYIVGIFMLILGGAAVAYAEAIGNSGLTIIYIILYKLQERENLLEREDEELKEEEEEEEQEASEEPEKEEKPNKKKSDETKEEKE
jgi:hypothetical protein